MHVVGTAGHVDHGKSTLVEALTGIDPDRLKEEKDREMTIDLGFAWLKPGDGYDEIGIIDVPGHRDFIENMLAGVGGIDLALIVIAADEGVMPQTKEHLAILDLLEIQSGIIVVTKVDLIDDPDWLELVTLEVFEALQSTALADAPVFQVSAINGQGIDELRRALIAQLNELPPRYDEGRPRLPIDRVFSLPGFGSIVTGTLVGGNLEVGEAVEIQPAGNRGRIRGLQTHQTKLQEARPGSRVAVNISGLSTDELRRGDVLAQPGSIRSTVLCDVRYRHLPDVRLPLQHNEEVKFFVGAAEVIARVRILGEKQIQAGEQGWLQLALRESVALSRGDRFILRRPSPSETLGGGQIIDPHPGRKHRRFRPEIVNRLESLAHGSPHDLIFDLLKQSEPILVTQLLETGDMDLDIAENAWQQLTTDGIALAISGYALSKTGWENLLTKLLALLSQYHANNPLRLGMHREEMRSRLRIPNALFGALVDQGELQGNLDEITTILKLPEHSISFTPAQQQTIDDLVTLFNRSGINSPSVKDVKVILGPEVYAALLDLEQIVQINEEVVYQATDYTDFVSNIEEFLREHGRANAGQIRDLLGTSRKYAIAILEYLDDEGITRREGDFRLLEE
ncbi:MAG TPA: selenocysteine-specific translation elongation factor [Patescibacteria group bacterium]|nr:selenocysteine-specific translation elongation factor [Patescibacteria group bacterium]